MILQCVIETACELTKSRLWTPGVWFPSLFLIVAGSVVADLPKEELFIGTGTQGGTYHRAGLAIATQVDVRTEAAFGLIARPTAGSIENLELLEKGEIDFAIVQQRVLNLLKSGELAGTEISAESLRSVGWLWQNVEHFLVTAALYRAGNLTDLKSIRGHGVYLGKAESGSMHSTSYILERVGIDLPEARIISGEYDEIVARLAAGEVDFASLPGGVPVSTVARAFSLLGSNLHLLSVTDEQAEMIGGPWSRFDIPARTYPFQGEAVSTIAQPNVLVVKEAVSEDVVSTVARAVYGACESLSAVHPAFAELTHRMEKQSEVWPRLHLGAARYFKEIEHSDLAPNCK
jgi:TRAP transporter TAXI family solute receptor